MKDTLLDIVTSLNPGQPELPEWVYNGAILGVQGGTDAMLNYLDIAEGAAIFLILDIFKTNYAALKSIYF